MLPNDSPSRYPYGDSSAIKSKDESVTTSNNPGLPKKERYPTEDNKFGIELKIHDVKQLFDQRDPAPFRERDLDDDAADYIVTCYQDLQPHDAQFLQIHLTQNIAIPLTEADVIQSIRAHFEYEAERTRKKVKMILKTGIQSLGIGLTFLTIATAFQLIVKPSIIPSFTMNFLKEGLMLLGWVSMWKPISIFLYDWWPLAGMRKTYIDLAHISIKIKVSQEQFLSKDETVRPLKAN